MLNMNAATLGIRLSEDLKNALERAAAADDRTVSGLVVHILKQWCAEQGHLPIPKRLVPARSGKRG